MRGLLLVAALLAQLTPTAPPLAPAAAPREEKALQIGERHIVEVQDYEAGRVLRLRSDESGALTVDVGASLSARRLDVTLRNVQGRVRFHADLSSLSRRLQTLVSEVDGVPPSAPQPMTISNEVPR
jgi:hypothetical protein